MSDATEVSTALKSGHRPRVGFISPIWLPRFGGAEQYVHRLALELISRGFDVRVFTQTAQKQGFDNGKIPATRLGGLGDFNFGSLFHGKPSKEESIAALGTLYTFMDAAARWVEANGIEVCILDNGLQQIDFIHARELYSVLKAMGVKRGLIHYDHAHPVENVLLLKYQQSKGTWAQVGQSLRDELKEYARWRGHFESAFMMGSPLIFEPDFVISCSSWSESFIDPLDRVPRIVVHPFIDPVHWTTPLPEDQKLPPCSALMVNPQNRKGPELMKSLIIGSEPSWTFRLLKGGWGNSFETFKPQILLTKAMSEGRVHFCDYVADMRQAYQSAGLLFFPSFQEGYGMTPVEAMYSGTPAVSSNYPAIMEAVGDGALTLCPYKDDPVKWKRAAAEVLSNRSAWIAKAEAHCRALTQRQENESVKLCEFLMDVVQH